VFAAADAGGKLRFFERSERGHDRHERRRASIIASPVDAPAFPDLAAIGRIETERRGPDGKLSKTAHYVVLSKRLSPERLIEVLRAHWTVENQLHWQLDVVFHEDDARTRKNYAPQNLGVLRRMALDILRAHPDNRSIARKMKLAAWKKEFFYELFAYL
jgi:predicted transposase YbfD/YdcC